jgi:cyclopropane fatty-acyl-phospholipid synthase-like methyltransferase
MESKTRLMKYWSSFWKSQAQASQGQNPHAQVLRTLDRQPVSPEAFSAIMASLCAMLAPNPNADLLDLCCGNGTITRKLFKDYRTINAVDLASEFVAQVAFEAPPHVTATVGDAKSITFAMGSFDRILLYAGLQYFSEEETVALFSRLRRWIRPGGKIVLGDIPDLARRWHFFDSPEREEAYFAGLQKNQPLVGFWFESTWLIKLAYHVGFSAADIHDQPEPLPYRHYRFDLVLKA